MKVTLEHRNKLVMTEGYAVTKIDWCCDELKGEIENVSAYKDNYGIIQICLSLKRESKLRPGGVDYDLCPFCKKTIKTIEFLEV